MCRFANDFTTWPEAQIDYETERHPTDGYPMDATMYELNEQFGRCIERNEYATAYRLLDAINSRAQILAAIIRINEQMEAA